MNLHYQLLQFYEQNGIVNDGGSNDAFFDFKIFNITLRLPNPEFRRKVIYIHDVEHVLYQCDTSWKGEAFIAGWEIGSGMWKHTPVNLLVLWAYGYSLLIYPREVFSGFKEGKQNIGIIDLKITKEALLALKPETVKEKIKKNNYQAKFLRLEFTFWCLISQLLLFAPFLLLILLYFYSSN